jgi:hypothetical protein
MRWNFSSRARALSDADAVVLSIPKSGRTWLRVFLSAYFCAKMGRPFSLQITDRRVPGIPRIIYSHDRFEHRTKASLWERLRGKYLVPASQLTHRPVLLLARDPRDAFASYYVQLRRRQHPAPEAVKRLPIGELLQDRRFGIGSMVDVMNSWVEEFGDGAHFRILRYEDLRAQPAAVFRKVLPALAETQIDEQAFEDALQFSTFENMQKLEASGAFADKILAPGNREDEESFKVRRGKIGGFADYLSGSEASFAAQVCARLDQRFGYRLDDDLSFSPSGGG